MARLEVPLRRPLWERLEARLANLDWEVLTVALWSLVVVGVLVGAYFALGMVASGGWPK